MSQAKGKRFEMARLEVLVGCPTSAELAETVGVTRRTICRWKADGLTERQADLVACRYDLHPALVWPASGAGQHPPRFRDGMTDGRWTPWDALAASDVELVWHEAASIGGGGLALIQGDLRVVLLHPSLASDDWKAAETLTHELIHHERGIFSWDGADNSHMPTEEATVRAMTAERMLTWWPSVLAD